MIQLYLAPNYDKNLAPVPASRYREWWEDNQATIDHARHCLPLVMANSLGYYILSPGTFVVDWDGNKHSRATIHPIEKSSHYEVDNHAAFGSFTVQAKFVPVTEKPGDFIYVKGIPNERDTDYKCMEACIEAWWNVGNFGLVYLLTKPGRIQIYMGQPIAQFYLYSGLAGATAIETVDGYPPGYAQWHQRRYRSGYTKDYDYMRGKTVAGDKVETHITTWKEATKFQ